MGRLELAPPLAGALIAAAVCAGCGGSEQPQSVVQSRATAAAAPLAVLRHPARPRDELPPALKRQLREPGLIKGLGADLATARQTAPGVWAVAAPAGVVCTAVSFAAVAVVQSCAEREKQDDALFVVTRLVRPRGTVIAGLVPDGVRRIRVRLAGGGARSVPVTDNGFRTGPLLERPVALVFRGPKGTRRQAVVRPPAP